jgi:Raf kinase inhibitor-like YbhB/YbcL family protein
MNTKAAGIAIPVIVLSIIGIAIYSLVRDGKLDFTNDPEPIIAMEIATTAFLHDGTIPAKYTCDVAAPVSPPILFSGFPEGTVSLALIMEDPDVPKALRPDGVFDHWVMFNIPTATTTIAEGKTAGAVGANGRGAWSYAAPCPPPEYEPSEHRYIFKLYALDTMLDLRAGATKAQVLTAMEGHILETAELIGRYDRKASSTPQ